MPPTIHPQGAGHFGGSLRDPPSGLCAGTRARVARRVAPLGRSATASLQWVVTWAASLQWDPEGKFRWNNPESAPWCPAEPLYKGRQAFFVHKCDLQMQSTKRFAGHFAGYARPSGVGLTKSTHPAGALVLGHFGCSKQRSRKARSIRRVTRKAKALRSLAAARDPSAVSLSLFGQPAGLDLWLWCGRRRPEWN